MKLTRATLNLDERVAVMGVLNVTPDSFSDGGRYLDPAEATDHGLVLADEGADIIDVGGESSRPGSEAVSESEELRRIIPVVEALASKVVLPVSVDTTKAAVARAALDAGAQMVNDISAGRFDPAILDVAAQHGAGLVLMHMQGTPKTMQQDPSYGDVVSEVGAFLHDRAKAAEAAGVAPDRIAIDPGFGFGKRLEHNLTLLARLGELRSVGYPILIGTSRKSFIGAVLGDLPVGERLEGTAATVALAVVAGAGIVRVHDVRAMVRVVRTTEAVLAAGDRSRRER